MQIRLTARGFGVNPTTAQTPQGDKEALEVSFLDAETNTAVTVLLVGQEAMDRFVAMINDPDAAIEAAAAERRSQEALSKIAVATVGRVDHEALKRQGLVR